MILGLVSWTSFLLTYNSNMAKLQIIGNCILTSFNIRPLLTRPFTDEEPPVPHDNMIQQVCEIRSSLR